jgi:hypothetical protein
MRLIKNIDSTKQKETSDSIIKRKSKSMSIHIHISSPKILGFLNLIEPLQALLILQQRCPKQMS